MSSDPAAAIALFAKPPTPGRVKTRLARDMGERCAAELARALLRDAWTTMSTIADREGWRLGLATTEHFDIPGATSSAPVWLQGDGDLGARIERACRAALEEAPAVLAIGADIPGIPTGRLLEAVNALQAPHHAVIGPARDGGFYLLGLRHCPPGLLADLPWSRSDTCRATEDRLRARGYTVTRLDPWFDIDELGDLRTLGRAFRDAQLESPATRAWFEALGAPVACPPEPGKVSIVMPTLDEATRVGQRLERLPNLPGVLEVIVADGGSTDGTLECVRRVQDTQAPLAVRWLEAPRGRAAQMNAGARRARGDTLLFLHADTELPDDAATWVRRVLSRPGVVAGAFETWTVDDTGAGRLGPLLHLADVRSRYSTLPYGDQAMFMRRSTFDAVGGFPELPLMEDLELSLRLRRLGRIATAPTSVRVSGRRFIERPIFYTLLVNIYPALYRLGVPAATLARWYRHVR